MVMNPLKLAKKERKPKAIRPQKWASVDPGKIAPPPPPRQQTKRLSRREELAQQAMQAEQLITIDVQGLDKLQAGQHKIPYRKDQMLRVYLHQAGLMMTGVKAAMYDTSCYEKGRLRTSHIPSPGTTILLCPTSYSPVHREKQSRKVDAEKVMHRMAKDTTHSMVYGARPEPTAPKKKETLDGVEQW